jgi:hypothetical protein
MKHFASQCLSYDRKKKVKENFVLPQNTFGNTGKMADMNIINFTHFDADVFHFVLPRAVIAVTSVAAELQQCTK